MKSEVATWISQIKASRHHFFPFKGKQLNACTFNQQQFFELFKKLILSHFIFLNFGTYRGHLIKAIFKWLDNETLLKNMSLRREISKRHKTKSSCYHILYLKTQNWSLNYILISIQPQIFTTLKIFKWIHICTWV